ncbi:unnamed protein product, partial [Ectocarpus sp. 12 AP-2014]
ALSAWRHLPAQKTSGVDANPLPLHEDLFHVQAGALGVAPSGGLGSEKICCKLCTREVQRSKMRLHVGGHILKDKALQVSTVCGFCGGVGCRSTIHDPPGKARPLVHSTCPSAPRSDARQEAVALNLGSAKAGSDTSPCTNMVLKCLLCSQDTYIWKYGMSEYVTRCHREDILVAAGTTVDRFKEAYTISEREKAKVLQKFKAGRPRRRGQGNEALPTGALGSTEGNGTFGRNMAGTRSLEDMGEEEEEEDEEQDNDDDDDDDEDDDDEEEEEEEEEERRAGGVEGQSKKRPARRKRSEIPRENSEVGVRVSKR